MLNIERPHHVPHSDKYPFIRKCNCCHEWRDCCSYYAAGVHRRFIKEVGEVLKENKNNFKKEEFQKMVEGTAEAFKRGNIYLVEEWYVNWIMKEDEE